MNCTRLIDRTEEILLTRYHKTIRDAQFYELHNALSLSFMAEITPDWLHSQKAHAEKRRAYYFSAEYLLGKQIWNNLFARGVLSQVKAALSERGADLTLWDSLPDTALGNGGLGRLAACILDSAATHNIPLDGYGLLYKYGLFSQRIEDGFQREYADDWQRWGNPWCVRREDERVPVVMGDEIYYAVPYDMPILGYKTDHICTLRLFSCEAQDGFDLSRFNTGEYALSYHKRLSADIITSVLYPNDDTYEGKRLRFMQQYLLSSAGMQDILRRQKEQGKPAYVFSAACAVQLNDTHPTLAIPELIRLLMNEGLAFSEALSEAKKTFCYTNHTVMAEALECWDRRLIQSVSPQIYNILCRIDGHFSQKAFYMNRTGLRIIHGDTVRMANLACLCSSRINGVSEIHTDILKSEVLKDFYEIFPGKFSNKTNGITQRRFLGVANPALTAFLTRTLGSDDFLSDLTKTAELREYINAGTISEFAHIKQENKKRLSERILQDTGVYVPYEFAFDVQIKRLHEYKRQLMNAFSIYAIYRRIKRGEISDFTPTCFIFAAKAAAGYRRAKGIIKYITELANLVNSDSDMQDKMRVVFLPDYSCSYAELIIPAADISEQISPVGTEASGTGNMKLMLSGAVTLGTDDGANIEIAQAAGYKNNYIFCRNAAQSREGYNPRCIYEHDGEIRDVTDSLTDGMFSDGGTGIFSEIKNSLLYGENADAYFVLRDFREYLDMKLMALSDYKDTQSFYAKCMANTAGAGCFSSDRTVREYASEIWNL